MSLLDKLPGSSVWFEVATAANFILVIWRKDTGFGEDAILSRVNLYEIAMLPDTKRDPAKQIAIR